MDAIRLGIDLGGSKILALALDESGQVLARAKCSTKGDGGYHKVLERIARTAFECLDEVGASVADPALTIGLGAPGPVLSDEGIILGAANLGWEREPLASDVGELLGGRRVILGNDVNLGALGECSYGAAAGMRSAFAAFMGTGLGGALVIDGQVVDGAHGIAGEFGHLPGPFDSATCGCGQIGCLETLASKRGIERLLQVARKQGLDVRVDLEKKKNLKAKHLLRAWQAECPATRWALQQSAEALGWGLGAVLAIADPAVFILGGGVLEDLGEQLLPAVRQGMGRFAFLLQAGEPDLRLAECGGDAVAIGAAVAAGRAA